MAALALTGTTTIKAQTAQIALQHNGNITMYSAGSMQEAIDAATANDTIFLNEGTFAGGFDIKKALTLIGSGTDTRIAGDVNIAIPDTITLTAYILDALNIIGNINIAVEKPISGVKVRKCTLNSLNVNSSLTKAFFERCYIKSDANLNGNYKDVVFYNSKVWGVRGDVSSPGDAVFQNCNLIDLSWCYNVAWGYINMPVASFTNCIIRGGNDA